VREIVFLNGRFQPLDRLSLPLEAAALISGYGLFETMRSYKGKIIYLKQHLIRIKDASKFLEIDFSYGHSRLEKIIRSAVKINGYADCAVRLIVLKGNGAGATTLITAKGYRPFTPSRYRQGFKALISPFSQNENSPLARIKSTNRTLYRLSIEAAKKSGYDEAVILNNRGYITEATRSNIFFVKSKAIYTPSIGCGCLKGVTRDVVFDLARKGKKEISEGSFVIGDLIEAEEAFLTNSLIGVMPLTFIGKRKIGDGHCGPLTKRLIKQYSLLLKK